MQRPLLERAQLGVYLLAIISGALLGAALPGASPWLELLLWPTLASLLYATFTQIPLLHLRQIWRQPRLLLIILGANFLIVPPVVWGLMATIGDDPVLRLGVAMVLLAPCTDWYVTFTHLGRGDARLALASTPLLLLAQMALLPPLIWLVAGTETAAIIESQAFAAVFVGLILIPLTLAWLTERWAESARPGARWIALMSHAPAPLLGLTLWLIAAANIQRLTLEVAMSLGHIVLIYLGYLALVLLIARVLGWLLKLEARPARTLCFSMGTRNSFVVLPFALALPETMHLVIPVIVLQSLVELAGMLFYLWYVPRLFPD
ncbi:MAG: arsenic resistance protein [Oscillochloridaceae bacterium]|nr:arsenic resistance protein [Chloroflexaceae bacterium]MDW8389002.1 arsenic resistance protein [Oscillochloridaceae bacterium]